MLFRETHLIKRKREGRKEKGKLVKLAASTREFDIRAASQSKGASATQVQSTASYSHRMESILFHN